MKRFFLLLIFTALIVPGVIYAFNQDLTERLHGYILLQVDQHGEAWYVRDTDDKRYYMANGDAAYSMMRFFSLGITDADLATIPSVSDTTEMLASASACDDNSLANSLKGKILLQVEQHGEAWYIYPDRCRMIYLEDGATAYTIMRFLGLGIADNDLAQIEMGKVDGYNEVQYDDSTSIDPSETSESTAVSWPSDIGTSHFGRLTKFGRIDSQLEGGWVRPHSGPFVWDWIEGTQGTYHWDQADEVVASLQRDRQAILATIWGFANWDQEQCHDSSDDTNNGFIRTMDWMHAPCDESAYLAWLSDVVERYDGDGVDDMPGLEYPVRHWEVFNEPSMQDGTVFFQDDAQTYAELLAVSYEAILAADSNAIVLPAGQAGMHASSVAYWDDVLGEINGVFDIGNIHSISSSNVFWSDDYRDYLDDFGYANTDFWVTEALVGDFSQNLSDDDAAQLTFTSYVNAFANGASVIFNVGAHDPTGGPGEASEETFEMMAAFIGAFSRVERIDDTTVLFQLPDGTTVYAIWDGASLPNGVTGTMSVLEYDGDSYEAEAREMTADIPLFAY